MRFEFIAEQKVHYPVVALCKVMRVSRSGYYGYLQRLKHAPTAQEVEELQLVAEIRSIHEESKPSTSYAYQRELATWGIQPSFTGIGACLDNAHIESFFATLKKELVYPTEFKTREQAESAIVEFINMFYNSRRLHSSLDYQTPNEFEAQGLERLAA